LAKNTDTVAVSANNFYHSLSFLSHIMF